MGLSEDGLELALLAVVAVKACASTGGIIAQSAARAVTSSLISESLHDIRARGAFNKGAIRTTASNITNTSDVLLRVPRGAVCGGGLRSKLLLCEAHPGVTATVRAHGTLASNSLVIGKAFTLASLSIANSLIGALYHRMSVISGHNISHPRRRPMIRVE